MPSLREWLEIRNGQHLPCSVPYALKFATLHLKIIPVMRLCEIRGRRRRGLSRWLQAWIEGVEFFSSLPLLIISETE